MTVAQKQRQLLGEVEGQDIICEILLHLLHLLRLPTRKAEMSPGLRLFMCIPRFCFRTEPGRPEAEAHAARFVEYTGMSPRWCLRLVLISLVLRVMGGCWVAFVALEYTRYYAGSSAVAQQRIDLTPSQSAGDQRSGRA